MTLVRVGLGIDVERTRLVTVVVLEKRGSSGLVFEKKEH